MYGVQSPDILMDKAVWSGPLGFSTFSARAGDKGVGMWGGVSKKECVLFT